MFEEKKKSNILLALLLSLLTALAGGLLFGIVYGIGYYIYLLASAEIFLAGAVYLKFAPKKNFLNITFGIIWCIAWTFIFNLFAIVVCEAMFVAKELGASFSNSYRAIIELWKTDAEIKAYMNKRMLEIALMILLGGFIYLISFVVSLASAKKNKKQDNHINTNNYNNPPQLIKTPTQQTTTIHQEKPVVSNTDKQKVKDIYLSAFDECKQAVAKYAKTKDQTTFRQEIKDIKAKYISNLDISTKEEIIKIINKVLTKEDLSTLTKKTNETLLIMFK